MKDQSSGVVQLGSWYAVAAVAAASFGLAAEAQDADATPVIVHPVGGPVTAPPITSAPGAIGFNLLNTLGSSVVTYPPTVASPGGLNVVIMWEHSAAGHSGGAFAETRFPLTSLLTRSAGSPGHFYAAKLGPNTAINSALFSSGARAGSGEVLGESHSGSHIGSWLPGDTGFIGLAAFVGTSQPYFGWAEIHLGSDFDPTLIAWGFNPTPGATDVTPSLPEPSSLLLLASGAAGLAAYRCRRAQRRAAAG